MTRDEIDKIRRRDAANLAAKNVALKKWRASFGDELVTDEEERDVNRKLDGLAEDTTPTDVKLARARAQNDTVAVDFCVALLAEEGKAS